MIGSFIKYFIICFIRGYQYLISPFLLESCRFMPSCSNYAVEAVKKHGICMGFILSLRRIFRCNPLCHKSGYDPVP